MGRLENSEQPHKIKQTDIQKYFFQAIKWSCEYGGSTGLFPKGRLETKSKGQENCFWIRTKFWPNGPWDHFYWLCRKSFCSKNTNVNVLPWTQRKVLPIWWAGSSPAPVHARGFIPHSSREGEEKGQGTCANLEPRLGADARERTAEPWFPSWKDAQTYVNLSWRRNTTCLNTHCCWEQKWGICSSHCEEHAPSCSSRNSFPLQITPFYL